jgi:hypothetical protein
MTTNQLVAMLFPTIPLIVGGAVVLFIRRPWVRTAQGVVDTGNQNIVGDMVNVAATLREVERTVHTQREIIERQVQAQPH